MKHLVSTFGLILVAISFLFLSAGCSDNPVGLSTGKPEIASKSQQIKLLKWKEPFNQETLAKQGFDAEWVFPFKSTIVGGKKTYNNFVFIPSGAVKVPTYVTVKVIGGEYAAVEFKPDMTFEKHVTITLSYANVDLEGRSPYDIKPVWYNPTTKSWEYVTSSVTVDLNNKTISFQTNHFSRYGWSW